MLAVFVVNNFLDVVNGNVAVGSLRNAIELANANNVHDTIIFQDYLFDDPGSHTIFLSNHMNGGQLELDSIRGVDIIGPGPGILTIVAANNNRIFLIDDGNEQIGTRVSISGLTLSGGNPLANNEGGRGGAILNRDFLTLTEVDISNNIAPNGGGGIFSDRGFVTIERSLIRNNISGRGGGGIQNGLRGVEDNLPRTTILNSTITGNTAIGIPLQNGDLTGYGGGVLNFAGTVNIEQSTIYDNTANVVSTAAALRSAGGGSATQGFDPEKDDDGAATVFSGFATTNIRSSILLCN
ncbi:MAG: hypothetical protein IH898_12725, partial [Planctomycetes bacterium]|nr:hypothetical protein [Planctomycetota bacterium]